MIATLELLFREVDGGDKSLLVFTIKVRVAKDGVLQKNVITSIEVCT